ncbi:MAG: methionine--tRNA ligase [Gammaproteobacteria bacterium]|nr:methionine--tRNA ligase [Gammaproteobacteria bacterium]MDH3372476.1 methionine--tRNA ligase [Gammaproteobacteria bacterium]MDH3407912.1 methionine--tRNA ligase [Gammaproteobacteria bacterium]MDH3551921.1 methionine--tRNA ligase [Gammaproteobacteria bacterium]
MLEEPRKILVTSALPYASGSLHMGHLVEYLQTDIWVRFQKLRGHLCTYVCASDAHGTPIMLKALELGISPEELTSEISAEFVRDFAAFGVDFDNYHTTHSPENEALTVEIFEALRKRGDIYTRTIEQAFDEREGMFLPDRYVRGTCPYCKTEDQYGDACENCHKTYTPTDLIDPISVVSGTTPVKRKSEHYFFKLSEYGDRLRAWMQEATLDKNVVAKLEEWFEAGLQDWDISREAPYFGFRIPGTEDKYFYVWLDAPVGYPASFMHLCERRDDLDFDEYWRPGHDTEVYHFIGKDIMYFHTLFWPAVLAGSGFRTPTSVFAHGFLTVNGKKMSKSRGTFIKARTYLDNLNPSYLRYYYAAKLGPTIEDIDLNLDDFTARVNSDLVGKLVNIASRCAGFIGKRFDGKLAEALPEPALFAEIAEASETIAEHFERREYSKAMRIIMSLADTANRYIDDKKPWVMIKNEDQLDEVQAVCTQGLNMFRSLMIYLAPVIPAVAEDARAFLNEDSWSWPCAAIPLLGVTINKFTPLLTRVEAKQVENMIEQSKESLAEHETAPEDDYISIDDFAKVDLRVARIDKAEAVEGADKLLALTLNLGDSTRQVFAGIKGAYQSETLVGRHVIVVANLAPRKMRFGVSEGMVLAAGPGGKDIFLLAPDDGAEPGMRVK